MHIIFRKAAKEDLPAIVKLLAQDELGKIREDFRTPLPVEYYDAFEHIDKDPNQELMVLENENHGIIGTFQLSFMQYLTYRGGIRAQVEAVRIAENVRGEGIGKTMFGWIIDRAKQNGCHLLQLTTDKKRPGAISFYQKLGFIPSHEGMKMLL